MSRFILVPVFVLSLVASAGPAKAADLKYEKKVTLAADSIETIYFDEPTVDKSTVTIKSPDAPVGVYLVLQSRVKAAQKSLAGRKEPTDVLAFKEKTQDNVFEIAPGKKPFALLLVSTGKQAVVQVKVTGK